MDGRRLAVLVAIAGVAAAAACADIVGIVDVPDGAVAMDSATADSSDAATMCEVAAPFGLPSIVQGIPADVAGITVSADELTAFFYRAVPYFNTPVTLSYATRSSPSASFGQEVAIPTDNRVYGVTMARDNLTYVWSHDDPYDGSAITPQHLFMARRSSTSQPFNMLDGGKPLTGLNNVEEAAPHLSADGTQLYFTELTLSSQTMMQSAADAGFSTSTAVPGLPNGAEGVVTSDGLVAYFGNDGAHVKVATRATTADKFGTPNIVLTRPDGGTVTGIAPALITDDRCKLYYEVDQEPVAADGSMSLVSTLYVATKTP